MAGFWLEGQRTVTEQTKANCVNCATETPRDEPCEGCGYDPKKVEFNG